MGEIPGPVERLHQERIRGILEMLSCPRRRDAPAWRHTDADRSSRRPDSYPGRSASRDRHTRNAAVWNRTGYPSTRCIPGGCKGDPGDRCQQIRSWSHPWPCPAFLSSPVIGHAIFVALEQGGIIGFPAAVLAHPAGADIHHIVGIAPVVFHHGSDTGPPDS